MRKPSKTRPKKPRDYREEYRKRVERGHKAGKSRAASRGHARAADLPRPADTSIDRQSPFERGLKLMRAGFSQTAAAKAAGVSVERLRRHRLLYTASRREGKQWAIFDSRPQAFWLVSGGKMLSVVIANDEGTSVSDYWRAVDRFLNTNDPDHLERFEGEGVTDLAGRFHRFETRPNVLRKLDSIGELNFIEIYADTV